MTREEAKDLLDNLIGMVDDNQESDYDTALKMGIKALEQEPILDKIRGEIENDWQLKKFPSSPFSCGLRRAIEIIDKYIADKEEINPYEKCKTCGENRGGCCGCPEVLELERKRKKQLQKVHTKSS